MMYIIAFCGFMIICLSVFLISMFIFHKHIVIILRILCAPFLLCIILIKYNYHAFKNVACFLKYGGEWITYAKNDKAIIQDIFEKLKQNK